MTFYKWAGEVKENKEEKKDENKVETNKQTNKQANKQEMKQKNKSLSGFYSNEATKNVKEIYKNTKK